MEGGLNAHPTGSVFKPFTALTGLTVEMLGVDETISCPGYHQVNGKRLPCFQRVGHGPMEVSNSLAISCNVFAYKVGERVGLERLVRTGTWFGLGQATGIELPEETGHLPTAAVIKRHGLLSPELGAKAGCGLAGVKVTPLQLARAYAALATGRLPQVHLVERVVGKDGQNRHLSRADPVPVPVARQHLAAVRIGLDGAVNDPRGTAHGIASENLRIAGKTGTIHGTPDGGATSSSSKPNAWFASFAPADNPKVVVVVFVARGGTGGSAAAPLARQALDAWHNLQ